MDRIPAVDGARLRAGPRCTARFRHSARRALLHHWLTRHTLAQVSHGDIKTENILVTSANHVYLTDFSAALKPVHLPLDDPSTFSYFFDTSSRRTCYLAPERFYEPGSTTAKRKEGLEWGKRDGKVTEEMDVFSAGCVLGELWMEGTGVFSLSGLFKYRGGEYSPEAYLAEIDDVEIRVSRQDGRGLGGVRVGG